MGIAAGAAFAVALIVANAPAARADTEPDPFEDLFGTAGVNSWTASTDSSLASSDAAFAGGFDQSVDNFMTSGGADHPFTDQVWLLDQSAFSANPFTDGGLPDNGLADFAVGLDYTLFASGIGQTLDPIINQIIFDLSDCFLSICYPL
jgi:hypothetical protein